MDVEALQTFTVSCREPPGSSLIISIVACALLITAAMPGLSDANAEANDERLAFGRVMLSTQSGDAIELADPGVFKSGDMFLMWIIPESGDKATRLQADESGEFFLELVPGNYVVADYEWSRNAAADKLAPRLAACYRSASAPD